MTLETRVAEMIEAGAPAEIAAEVVVVVHGGAGCLRIRDEDGREIQQKPRPVAEIS